MNVIKIQAPYESDPVSFGTMPVQDVVGVPVVPIPIPADKITPLTDHQMDSLIKQGFTRGLARSLEQVKQSFALRIWVVDNSSSMLETDGHRIIDGSTNAKMKMVPCTRWAEIRECVQYHIRMADLLHAPTRFRFLNHPGQRILPTKELSIADTSSPESTTAESAIRVINRVQPHGCTPLTNHIRDIYQQVLSMEGALRESGQRVAIIIATDGLPTDEYGHTNEYERSLFVESLRKLEGLSVWVVIRLCTDEETVVDFYNNIDSILELSVDVLDDFHGEALEIHAENPWLSYGLVLHRMREMGHHDRLFDLIDERPFSKEEVRDFLALIVGNDSFDGAVDPSVDWNAFLKTVSRLMEKEKKVYNPIRDRSKSWVSIKKLERMDASRKCPLWF